MFTTQITLLGNGMMEPIKPLTLTLSCIANIPPQLDYPVHLVSNPMPVTSITQGVHVPFNGNIPVGVQPPSLGMPMQGQPPVPGMNYWNLGNQISQWPMSFQPNGFQYGNQFVPSRQYYMYE